jgi:hypothetical protein
MSHRSLCARLGLVHEELTLVADGPKRWRASPDSPWGPVERAAFDVRASEGWRGDHGEGGLILSLIKAASIRDLPATHASVFVEALYYHPPPRGLPPPAAMLANIASVSIEDIQRTYGVLAVGPLETPVYYPTVTREKVADLFVTLGRDRLHAIAEIFAQAPYDFRAGWPDLTLWRNGEVIFREVKAPSDRLQASQKQLFDGLLGPLGLNTGVIDVIAG